MNSILDRYLNVRTDNELVAQRGRLLNGLILIMSIADLLTLLYDVFFGSIRPEYLYVELLAFVMFGVLYWYTRRGYHWPPYVFVVFMALIAPYAFQTELQSPAALALAASIVVVPLIAPSWMSIPSAAVEAIMVYALNAIRGSPFPSPLVVVILGALGTISWLSSRTLENAFQEARRNALALTDSNRELEASHTLLEKHARELERRSAYLQASAQVSQTVTSILETQKLIRQVVELVRQRLDLYYVGLFLVDEAGEWAVLRAGTGQAGQVMLARGHRLRVGGGSMIGWSIANAQARIALEASEDAVRLATPELPETRSEAALPLRSRGQVLGALTIQSSKPGAFDQDTLAVLQTMADQVAVALDNAHLFAESQAALDAMRRTYGEQSRQAWIELLRTRPDLAYRGDEHGLMDARHIWRPEMEQALQTGQTVRCDNAGDEARLSLAVPLRVHDNIIGVLDTFKPGDAGGWTAEEIAWLETLTEQLSLALDSARLHQDTQRRVARERMISDVTTRVREMLDPETVLKVAAQEVRQALGLPEVIVSLATASTADASSIELTSVAGGKNDA